MKSKLIVLSLLFTSFAYPWGFFAHKKINEYAIFCLPKERLKFYKPYIEKLISLSIIPDIRKNTAISEYAMHYIDLEYYHVNTLGFSALKLSDGRTEMDSCLSKGVLPWHLIQLFDDLKTAIRFNQISQIIRISGEMGHYLADACVPLHTTENYDGQLTGQHGIHGLWESSLPEIYFNEYNMFGIKADTILDIRQEIWRVIEDSHHLKDSVLLIHKELTERSSFPIYGITERGTRQKADYSDKFKRHYHKKLNQMITKQLKKSILLCASMWETAWVQVDREKEKTEKR